MKILAVLATLACLLLAACGATQPRTVETLTVQPGQQFLLIHAITGEQRTFAVNSDNGNFYAQEDIVLDAPNSAQLLARSQSIQFNPILGEGYSVMDITGLLFGVKPEGDNYLIEDLGGDWRILANN